MKKIVIIIVAFLLICTTGKAQKVVSSSGSDFTSPSWKLCFTLGEPAIKTYTGANYTLSQGFHQPLLPSCEISATITAVNVSCYGGNDGSAMVTVTGGTSPYIYLWNNGLVETSNLGVSTNPGVSAGIYTVTVTDAALCTAVASVIITEPSPVIIVVSAGESTCGDSTGYASAIATGGTPPYAFQWNNGSIDSIIDSLAGGIYLVTVTDVNGCSTFSYATVDESDGPAINVITANVACYNGNNGSIDIGVISGTPPYTYNWSNGSTTQDISALVAGTYDLIVTDDNDCQAVESFIIGQPENIVLTVTTTDATCGLANGTASVIISGGVSPYSISWSTGATLAMLSGLAAGSYTLTVTDTNGCTKVKSTGINISSTEGPQITADSIIHAGCNGSDGAIYITVSGGIPPYSSFLWSNGMSTEDITGLYPGVYCLTVTDIAGCQGVFSDSIFSALPEYQPLCLVTVDSVTGKNLIIWEKIQEAGIAHYNIYRESNIAGLYYIIATIPGNNLSEYIDEQSYPKVRAYRYKISAVDECNNESPLSTHHKTMHLTINEGIGQSYNLIWDHYEGFPFGTYLIYRHTNQTGWQLIDSIPNNLTSYTDWTPSMGQLYYRIGVLKNDSCFSSGDLKAQGGPYAQSFSNLDDNGIPVYIYSTKNNTELKIYPNPTRGTVIIEGLQAGKIELMKELS
ncbi:MAG: SprB repeat-containing protein [Bacteroidia bacterium]|nr:SprB repeat-containing protein [Bacteroidia bacterium]